MISILKDLVAHTQPLDSITSLKLTQNVDSVFVETYSDDKSVIVYATTVDPIPELNGVFGIGDLPKLAYLVKNPEYQTNAKISVKSEDYQGKPRPIHVSFENESGDFKNVYRFMNKAIIEERLKDAVVFNGANWNVVVSPSMQSIAKFKLMAGAHNEENIFQAKTKDGNLVFYFGDGGTHNGNFVFQSGVSGKFDSDGFWPIKQTLAILNLDGEKTMSFSEQGVVKIDVKSGLINYEYLIPVLQK